MITICFMNQKGGVGKTTSVTSTARILTERGYKVLVVDLDQQGNCGRGVFNIDTEDKSTVFEVIKGEAQVSDAIQRSYTLPVMEEDAGNPPKIKRQAEDRGIDVLPSDSSLSGLTLIGASIPGVQVRLRRALAEVAENYDFCLIDCPPAIGFETIIALTASDYAVILSMATYFSADGMTTLNGCIDEVREWYNPQVKPLGILITLYNAQTKISRRISDEIGKYASTIETFVYDSRIRKCIRAEEAHDNGLTVVEYAPKCTTSQDYESFVDELVSTLEKEGHHV